MSESYTLEKITDGNDLFISDLDGGCRLNSRFLDLKFNEGIK